jgi:chromosome segregation ATPase
MSLTNRLQNFETRLGTLERQVNADLPSARISARMAEAYPAPPHHPTYTMLSRAIDAAMDEREDLNQAIDAFMDEREELKAMIEASDAAIDSISTHYIMANNRCLALDEALTEANRERLQQHNTLMQAQQFVGAARQLLARIGVAVDTGDDGQPKLSIDQDQLLNAVEAMNR